MYLIITNLYDLRRSIVAYVKLCVTPLPVNKIGIAK